MGNHLPDLVMLQRNPSTAPGTTSTFANHSQPLANHSTNRIVNRISSTQNLLRIIPLRKCFYFWALGRKSPKRGLSHVQMDYSYKMRPTCYVCWFINPIPPQSIPTNHRIHPVMCVNVSRFRGGLTLTNLLHL
jgi:hypothetical protein